MAKHTEVRLLEGRDLRPGSYSVAELTRFGYWPPWVSADLDGDGRMDVAAVVAVPSGKEVGFGVVAIHARSSKKLQWVVPPQPRPLFGVALGVPKDTLVPLQCVECDSNAWFRWSGKAYAPGLFKVGENVAIVGSDKKSPQRLFKKSSLDSDTVADLKSCVSARILRVKRTGHPETYWYEVELKSSARVHGWTEARWTAVDCTWMR